MTLLDQGRTSLPPPGCEETEASIDRLKARLSEETVADLAKEVLARVALRAEKRTLPADPIPEARVEKLALALLSESPGAAAEMVQGLLDDGVPAESVYLDHLAPAARMLGAWWNEDRVPFAMVSIGTSRISGIMRRVGRLFPNPSGGFGRSAVFASVPAETHTIGMHMAADLFRKEGWVIDLKTGFTHDALVAGIRTSASPVVGLSAGGAYALPRLSRLVAAIRKSSPGVSILVSGQIVQDLPDLLTSTGVEAIATDFPTALAAMEALWERAIAGPARRTA